MTVLLSVSSKTLPVPEDKTQGSIDLEPTLQPTPSHSFSAQLANYPITANFNRSAKRLLTEYNRMQKDRLLHIAAYFTDTLEGLTQELACMQVEQYITDQLQPRTEGHTCTPTFSCDYDQARFPATLIKVTCPKKKCIDVYQYRGACLPRNSDLTYLRFKEEDRVEQKEANIGSGDGLYPVVRTGKWYHHTVTLTRDCYCSDAK